MENLLFGLVSKTRSRETAFGDLGTETSILHDFCSLLRLPDKNWLPSYVKSSCARRLADSGNLCVLSMCPRDELVHAGLKTTPNGEYFSRAF